MRGIAGTHTAVAAAAAALTVPAGSQMMSAPMWSVEVLSAVLLVLQQVLWLHTRGCDGMLLPFLAAMLARRPVALSCLPCQCVVAATAQQQQSRAIVFANPAAYQVQERVSTTSSPG